MSAVSPHPADPARAALVRLKTWVSQDAYPLWWRQGADHRLGGFHEKLDNDGNPVILPKRARVQPRQIYAFSQAQALGWSGDAAAAVRHGLDFYLRFYRRPDGLFRTLVAPDGAPLKDNVDFYDQAFALLGLHSAHACLGDDARFREPAHALIGAWIATRKHPDLGFEEAVPRILPLGSNPHMHLLESCQAWAESDPDGPWLRIGSEIVQLALSRLIDGQGALREFFDGAWQPMAGDQGRLIEPGHQFEWAWLLMRWSLRTGDPRALQAALRLIEIGETQGVDPARGVAINSLWDDLTPRDRKARLWPQTERLKAHCLAAELTRDSAHWRKAAEAAEGLMRYLVTPLPGSWRDMMLDDGSMIDEPAPASSFYHIVCAIRELDRAVATASD